MTDWAAVLGNDFPVPENRSLDELTGELCEMLAATDPQVRDDTAYPVLAFWTARGVLDGRLAKLGNLMAARLAHAEIQARTFAAMILGWVVLRDAQTAELASDDVRRWLGELARWWLSETDLRGWDPQLGWLHAAAHGADAVRAFGRSPRLDEAELKLLLALVASRLLKDDGYLYADGEDDRIAYAAASILTRRELSPAAATGWLDRSHETLASGEPGPMPMWASNTLRTLTYLYVYADRGVRWYDPQAGEPGKPVPVPLARAVKDRVAKIISPASRGLG